MAEQSARAALRDEKVTAARFSVYSNSLLTLLKLIVGVISGSVSVLSEAAHSATDLIASLIAFFSVRIADAPADEEHPYGHGKIESISGMAEALLIFGAAAFILYEAINRLMHDRRPEHLDLGIAVMAVSAVANALVARYLFATARRTDSLALHADGEHLRTDVLTSVGVVVGLVAVRITGLAWIDSAIGIAVAALILHAAWVLTRGALHPLMDTQLPPEETQVVRDVLEQEPRVLGYHKLRTRKSGSARYVDAHVLMDDAMTLLQAHDLTERLEDRIREKLPNAEITLHTEPYHAERRHQYEKHGGPCPDEVDKGRPADTGG